MRVDATENKSLQPRLPEDYRLDVSLDRSILSSHYAKRLDRTIKVVRARPEDERVVVNFIRNEYFRATATMRCLRMQIFSLAGMQSAYARLSEVPVQYSHQNLTRWSSDILNHGLVFLALDGAYVCGVAVNKQIAVERAPNAPHHSLEIPDSKRFDELLDAATVVTHKGQKSTRAVCAWFKELTPQLLPLDCSRYFCFDMLTVQVCKSTAWMMAQKLNAFSPTTKGRRFDERKTSRSIASHFAFRCQVAQSLWLESLKRAAELGESHIMTETTAVGSTRLAEKASFASQTLAFSSIRARRLVGMQDAARISLRSHDLPWRTPLSNRQILRRRPLFHAAHRRRVRNDEKVPKRFSSCKINSNYMSEQCKLFDAN